MTKFQRYCKEISTDDTDFMSFIIGVSSTDYSHSGMRKRQFSDTTQRFWVSPLISDVCVTALQKFCSAPSSDAACHGGLPPALRCSFNSSLSEKADQIQEDDTETDEYELLKKNKHLYVYPTICNTLKDMCNKLLEETTSETLRGKLRQLSNEVDKVMEILWRWFSCINTDFGFDEDQQGIKSVKQLHKDLTETYQTIEALTKDVDLHKNVDLQSDICSHFCRLRMAFCVLLGLQPDSVEDFEKMGERAGYYSEGEWILKNLENSFRYLEDEQKHELSVHSLVSLGFTEYAATALVDSIPTNLRGHRSTIDWVTIYIENQFKYNILLAPVFYGDFPFQDKLIGRWFTLSNAEAEGATSECNLTNVSLINLEGKEDDRYKTQHHSDVFRESPQDDPHLVLFHGTDHFSAKDILFNGIDLMESRKRCDFSHGKGFYLTRNLQEGIDWAFSRPKGRPSVLVYRVETAWLKAEGRQYLDLTDDLERWKKIVRHNTTRSNDAKLDDQLDEVDYIEGPINTNSPRSPKKRDPFPEPDSYQLCVKSKRFARDFNQRIHSALFYR